MDICIRCGNRIEDEDPSYDAEMYILELSQDNIKCQLEDQLCASCAKQYERRLKKRTTIMNPRPESRIESLEKRASTIEATLVELSSDTAEELKAIRQEMKSGFLEIGKAFDLNADNIEAVMQDVAQIKTDVAELKGDITSIKATQEQILKLLQQKSGE